MHGSVHVTQSPASSSVVMRHQQRRGVQATLLLVLSKIGLDVLVDFFKVDLSWD